MVRVFAIVLPSLPLSQTYEPQSGQKEQGRRVAGFLSDVTRTVNTLLVETSQRSLAEGAQTAVDSLIAQAGVEFQAQGNSVSKTRAAMEALFAS
eukprot:7184751-Alexandrium_andersonii.AAC.1